MIEAMSGICILFCFLSSFIISKYKRLAIINNDSLKQKTTKIQKEIKFKFL